MCRKMCVLCGNLSGKLFAILFLVLLKDITAIGSYKVDTHRITKRMDLELCLAQFEVHSNTIIRTEESIAIGGKYLQGLEIETLEECQRLCCETDGCDVYIFEEKSKGYCYLFECGPPENFHCKFTRHANYTSSVLTPLRTVPNPTTSRTIIHLPPMNISQQERELTNLKQKTKKQLSTTTTTQQSPIDLLQKSAALVTTTKSGQLNTSSCSRFQFTCHSGECIAVYNACDGIPQCEDGSDEGPECSGAVQPAVSSKNSLSNGNGQDLTNAQSAALGSVSVNSMMSSPKMPPPSILAGQSPYQSIITPLTINREDPSVWGNRKIPNELQSDDDRNSRIFSHKGGIQLPTNNMPPFPNQNQNSFYNSMQRAIFMQPDVQTSYRNSLIQPQDHMNFPMAVNWQQQQQQQQQQQVQQQQLQPIAVEMPYSVHANPQLQQLNKPISPIAPIINNNLIEQEQQNLIPAMPSPVPAVIASDPNQKDETSLNSKESEEYEDATDFPKKKPKKHKKEKAEDSKSKSKSNQKIEKDFHHDHDPHVHEQYKIIQDKLVMEFRDHDGHSDRPGGAVLSLTLGLLITALLAILVGCRMRTISRRSRRLGKGPYAHDPDFLVNGMYL